MKIQNTKKKIKKIRNEIERQETYTIEYINIYIIKNKREKKTLKLFGSTSSLRLVR